MRLSVLSVFLLAACDTPSTTFRGAPVQRITVAQSTFDVRVLDRRAEAIRLNGEWAPRLAAVELRARIAIETVSGCKVTRLRGDQAIMIADLKCTNEPDPLPPVAVIFCDIQQETKIFIAGALLDARCE